MFKKDPQPKASANIKSSERRKLFANICETYHLPKERVEKEQELAILPNIVKQSTFKSIQKYQGTIYYDENETPIYFKSRDSQIYPSLFTLWKVPYILPTVLTNSYVIEVLAGGADLMLPGCGVPFDNRITKGTVVGVVGSDAPTVIKAIGIALMDLKDIQKTVGTSGVAVQIIHHLNDELYKKNEYVDIAVPKEVDNKAPWEETQEAGDDENVENEENRESEASEEKSQAHSDAELEDLALEVSELNVEDIDKFFTRALLQSIKLDTITVPISASNFMANHVLKNLPVLDTKYKSIKKTSWKKTGKYLKAMSKLGYIQVKGKDDDLTIISTIPKSEKIIVDFITHKVEKQTKKDASEDKKKNMIRVVQLYQPTGKYRSFFNELNEDYTCLYEISEIKALVTNYIKKKNLVHTDPKKVKVDSVLSEVIPGELVARNEIVNKFLKYFTLRYAVIQPGKTIEESEIQKGEVPKVEIICETKIGRKTVTRVKNFSRFGIKPHIISEDLRNLCQGSSTLEETREGTEVIVQGPHYKIILDYLTGKGIPSSLISYEDKSKGKKKRR